MRNSVAVFSVFGLLALALSSGCSEKDEAVQNALGGIEDADEVAFAAVDGLVGATNLSGAYLAFLAPPAKKDHFSQSFGIPNAEAATCGSVGGTTLGSCTVSGGGTSSRTRQFNSCTIGALTTTGSTTFTYSTVNCTTPTGAGTVTRVPALLFTGRRGANLSVSATSHTDYRGTTIAGGQQMSFADAGGGNQTKTYNVLGLRRVLSGTNGSALADLSYRTTSAITVTGSSLSDLMLDGGKLEVAHNLKNYTAAWVPFSLRWQGGCTCPTSGSLTAGLSGAYSGSLTIEFTACGSAKLIRGADQVTLTLDSCGGST